MDLDDQLKYDLVLNFVVLEIMVFTWLILLCIIIGFCILFTHQNNFYLLHLYMNLSISIAIYIDLIGL
jgi:hypothetical protein